jgi:MOSC domain
LAEVVHLFVCVVHRLPMRELEEAEALENKGFRDCIHGRRDSQRQVSMIDLETLDLLGVKPGQVKENITTRGLEMKRIQSGMRLRIGEALLEVTIACDPCSRMDEIRQGLQEELRGRRGWLFRVLQGGSIRRGDSIKILNHDEGRQDFDNEPATNKTASGNHHGVGHRPAGDDGSGENAGILRHPV